MIYAWVCLIVVALVINRNIPLFGKMREAEERVAETGQLVHEEDAKFDQEVEPVVANSNMLNFFVPIGSLIFFTWLFDIDIMAGAMAAIFFTVVFFTVQNLMPISKMFDAIMSGFIGMIAPLGTLFCGFMLAELIIALGLQVMSLMQLLIS